MPPLGTKQTCHKDDTSSGTCRRMDYTEAQGKHARGSHPIFSPSSDGCLVPKRMLGTPLLVLCRAGTHLMWSCGHREQVQVYEPMWVPLGDPSFPLHPRCCAQSCGSLRPSSESQGSAISRMASWGPLRQPGVVVVAFTKCGDTTSNNALNLSS